MSDAPLDRGMQVVMAPWSRRRTADIRIVVSTDGVARAGNVPGAVRHTTMAVGCPAGTFTGRRWRSAYRSARCSNGDPSASDRHSTGSGLRRW
jgi:hypothetical protein